MLRCRLFVLGLLAAGMLVPAAPAQPQKKTLDTLTTQDVQQRVLEFLQEHPPVPWLTERVDLNPRTINWTRVPPTIRWALPPVRGKATPVEVATIRADVEGILKDALGNYKGGLLSSGFNEIRFDVTVGPVPEPVEVDEDAIRRRVAEFLAQQTPYVRLLSQFVILNPEGIIYRRTRRPGALTWTVTTRSDVKGHEALIKENVGDVLVQALGSYKGGLLPPAELTKVRPLIEVQLHTPPTRTARSTSAATSAVSVPVAYPVAVVPLVNCPPAPRAQPAPTSTTPRQQPRQQQEPRRIMPIADATEPPPRQLQRPPVVD